jgi:chemotaxis response regulator CheB
MEASLVDNRKDRILVVDDHPDNVEIINARLSSRGFVVETATNGQEALDQVRANPPHLILLDALYGKQASFDQFIGTGKRAQHHKLLLISSDTAAESRAFIKRYPYAVVRDKLPGGYEELTPREKRARLLYIRSQIGHGALAEGGKALPLVLRLTPLRRL